MRVLKKNFYYIVFFIFLFIIFTKNILNIVKTIQEFGYKPTKLIVKVCPPKDSSYFKNISNGSYLYAFYKYKSMGIKCKKN